MTASSIAKVKPAPVTRTVANWLAGLKHQDVPPNLRHALRLLVTDTFGATLAGLDQPWTKSVAAWADRGALPVGTKGLATAWGKPSPRLRPSDAALVNGTAAHAFEMDDFHNAKLHPGAVVVPALWVVRIERYRCRGCASLYDHE